MAVTHTFTSGIADSAAAQAAGEVLPSHWNADHDLSEPNTWGGEQSFPFHANSVSWLASDDQGFAFGFGRDVADYGNHIWNSGYNLGSTAYSGEPTWYVSMESNYDTGAGPFLMEYHLNYVSGDTLTSRRPFSISVDRSTHAVETTYVSSLVTYYDVTGVREQFTVTPAGTNNSELVSIIDHWDSGANHYGIRYNLASNDAAASAYMLSMEVAGVQKFAVRNDGYVGIGLAIGSPSQMLDISYNGPVAAQITDISGTDTTLRFLVSGGVSYIDSFGGNARMKFRTVSSGNSVLDIEGNFVRVGNDNYNGATTLSVWDGIATTGSTELALREGAGQSTNDIFTVYVAGSWTVKRASISAEAFRYYGAYTDSSNYVRASLAADATTVTLAAQTAGSGADNITINLTPAGTGVVASVAPIKTQVTTVGALMSAATAGAGARAFVTDANSTTFLATAAAGGANAVPVVSNGTIWVIG